MKPRFLLSITAWLVFGMILNAQSLQRIFYSTFSPQDWDIYISKDGGKHFDKFTDHPSLDYDAVISPDGKWIVFTSESSGLPQLYVRAVDGDQPPRAIIKSNSFQDQAAFSPDGRQLAFVASHEGNAEIYLIRFLPDSLQDISDAVNVTLHKGGDFRPSFSPDGKKIAFCSDRNQEIIPHPQFPFARQRKGNIYIADLSGKNVKQLTDSNSWNGSPDWSDDGNKILFYSDRSGKNSIFEMKTDGSDQKEIIEFGKPAVSPKYLPDGKIAFTTWNSEDDFKIMLATKGNKDITTLHSTGHDLMFNADFHPDGLVVFHGGTYPSKHLSKGNFGFDGDVLANLPRTLEFSNQKTESFGVRRAFVAPPQHGNHLLFYDAGDIRSFFEFLKPLGYSIFWLPLLVIVLFIIGLWSGYTERKKMPVWKYLLFSLATLFFGAATGGIFLYVDAIQPMPVSTIRWTMGLLTLFFILLGYWQFKRASGLKTEGLISFRLCRLYSYLFYGLALFCFSCTAFINQFVNSTLTFYQVDYLTNERKPVFTFEKEPDINPANFSVLDSKVTHDGKAFIFTTGSFRGRASTQGDIWKYEFESKSITKLSDSPCNDGFGDLSENGKMVFRSGRSGYFDIYLTYNNKIINLTRDEHRDNFPAISKQGDKIVFASDRLTKNETYKTMDIFLITSQENDSWSAPELISVGNGQNAHPHFSPDGEWVIYTTEAYGINDEQSLIQPIIFSPQMYGEIVAYNIKEKKSYRLTHNKWEEGTPLWVE